MKKFNLISNSKKIKLEITIQNQIIWKDLDNIFCTMVLDLLSKITEDKNKRNTSVSILLTDDFNIKEMNKIEANKKIYRIRKSVACLLIDWAKKECNLE